jgi:hypothetical protein
MGAWELDWVKPVTLTPGEIVLEEIQRVVVGRGGLWSGKLGLTVAPNRHKRMYFGGMAEAFTLVGRDPKMVYRAGPAFWVGLTEHTELGGYLTWPFYGPDHLGFMTGMYGAIGLQYQIATGEPRPGLP